ncbi:unnamed protein product, partial [Effrenium voratum]
RSIFNEMLGIGYVTLIFMQTLGTNVGRAARLLSEPGPENLMLQDPEDGCPAAGILPTAPAAVSDMLSWTPAVS